MMMYFPISLPPVKSPPPDDVDDVSGATTVRSISSAGGVCWAGAGVGDSGAEMGMIVTAVASMVQFSFGSSGIKFSVVFSPG